MRVLKRKEAGKHYQLFAQVKGLSSVHLVLYLLHVGVLGNLEQNIKMDVNKISDITKGHY